MCEVVPPLQIVWECTSGDYRNRDSDINMHIVFGGGGGMEMESGMGTVT